MSQSKKKQSALVLRLDWINSMRGKVVRRAGFRVKLVATIEGKPGEPPLCRVMDTNGQTTDVPFKQIGEPTAEDAATFNAEFQAALRAKDAAKIQASSRV